MASGNYILIPSNNPDRNANELRSVIDTLHSAYKRLSLIAEKMSQMDSEGDGVAIEQQYQLEAGDGTTVRALIASASGELDGSPFLQQLLSRMS